MYSLIFSKVGPQPDVLRFFVPVRPHKDNIGVPPVTGWQSVRRIGNLFQFRVGTSGE
jgi:hypothetical protein